MSSLPHSTTRQRVTIADVAKFSGLAKSTISKALNYPADQNPLSEETRARAVKAAEALGYRPAWTAQALRRKSTQTIGLVHWSRVPDAAGLWQGMFESLGEHFYAQGYDLQFISNSERAPAMLEQGRFDGVVVAHRLQPEMFAAIQQLQLPVVMLNAEPPDGVKYDAPSVRPNDYDAGLQLGRYLIKLGHRQLGYVDTHEKMRHFSYAERLRGLMTACREADIREEVLVYRGPLDGLMDQYAAATVRPTALVAYDDRAAMPLLSSLWSRGIRVPQDVSVATFNDTPFTQYAIPPLTTMRMPSTGMANAAADLLLRALGTSEGPALEEHVVLPAELVVRQSTVPPVK